MTGDLPASELTWLERFFAAPNELSWAALAGGTAPAAVADQVRQWLAFLKPGSNSAPIILPFMRGGHVSGWYATTQGRSGGYELSDEIKAWLGPTWLSRVERVSDDMPDPMARILRDRFDGTVYRFTGPEQVSNTLIAERIADYGALLGRRPPTTQRRVRPVGAVRRDFDCALLARDEAQAEAMIAELRESGRLNEENLRYLGVRLDAGLGLWPQIARNHWLIKTMVDLALPPQVLADIIEALYRTYVEGVEAAGDPVQTLRAFESHIAQPYPKLFASRRGIRAPRVVKSFLLFEQLQVSPSSDIVAGLLDLLPDGTATSLLLHPLPHDDENKGISTVTAEEADEAFDDGQLDRALEFYLRLPPTRKSVTRLLSCVLAIGTDEASNRFLTLVDGLDDTMLADLSPAIAGKIDNLRSARSSVGIPPDGSDERGANPWMQWAEQLAAGRDLPGAEHAAQVAATNWDAAAFQKSPQLSQRFVEIIGRLGKEASDVARGAVPQIFASFFPLDCTPAPAAKPIASHLFLLIAMDDILSRPDLDLLAQLTAHLIEMGVSSDDYIALVGDLKDVQQRVGSYAYLPWSLDVCEMLATAPCPSDAARDARLRLFSLVLGQATSFAHRLGAQDILPIETLAKDFGVDQSAISALKRDAEVSGSSSTLPSLDGKTIGIYTLAEAAGARARATLERLFPGCKVIVNSDLVCTTQLTSLAKAADMFVFAWKSSSHQAFYCVKDALADREPIWAPGKGTASILRAILDHLN